MYRNNYRNICDGDYCHPMSRRQCLPSAPPAGTPVVAVMSRPRRAAATRTDLGDEGEPSLELAHDYAVGYLPVLFLDDENNTQSDSEEADLSPGAEGDTAEKLRNGLAKSMPPVPVQTSIYTRCASGVRFFWRAMVGLFLLCRALWKVNLPFMILCVAAIIIRTATFMDECEHQGWIAHFDKLFGMAISVKHSAFQQYLCTFHRAPELYGEPVFYRTFQAAINACPVLINYDQFVAKGASRATLLIGWLLTKLPGFSPLHRAIDLNSTATATTNTIEYHLIAGDQSWADVLGRGIALLLILAVVAVWLTCTYAQFRVLYQLTSTYIHGRYFGVIFLVQQLVQLYVLHCLVKLSWPSGVRHCLADSRILLDPANFVSDLLLNLFSIPSEYNAITADRWLGQWLKMVEQSQLVSFAVSTVLSIVCPVLEDASQVWTMLAITAGSTTSAWAVLAPVVSLVSALLLVLFRACVHRRNAAVKAIALIRH